MEVNSFQNYEKAGWWNDSTNAITLEMMGKYAQSIGNFHAV